MIACFCSPKKTSKNISFPMVWIKKTDKHQHKSSKQRPGVQSLLQLPYPRRCLKLHRAQHHLPAETLQGHAHCHGARALFGGVPGFFKNLDSPCSTPTCEHYIYIYMYIYIYIKKNRKKPTKTNLM